MKKTASRYIIPIIIGLVVLCVCSVAGGYWLLTLNTAETTGEVVKEGFCIDEGQVLQVLDGNEYVCCTGLNPVSFTHPVTDDPSGCSLSMENTKICINCGDGICGVGEDHCICPADCGNK